MMQPQPVFTDPTQRILLMRQPIAHSTNRSLVHYHLVRHNALPEGIGLALMVSRFIAVLLSFSSPFNARCLICFLKFSSMLLDCIAYDTGISCYDTLHVLLESSFDSAAF